jgi:predicted dehydrogenase
MGKRTITVAVLGTGRMGQVHAKAWSRLRDEGFSVSGEAQQLHLAIYGRDAAKAASLAAQVQAERSTTRLEELLVDPSVDVVDNTLTNSMHRAPLLEAASQHKHLFCEKPLAPTLREAQDMLQAARDAGVKHGITQNMRFAAGPSEAKKIIDSGQLGRIFHAQVIFGYYVPEVVANRPSWFYRKEVAGGGIALDMLAHFLDLLPWMLGPLAGISCQSGLFLPQREDGCGETFAVEVEDTVATTLRFASGALAEVFCSWVRRRSPNEVANPSFQIDGERGSCYFGLDRLWVKMGDGDWSEAELEPVDPWAVQFREFALAVVNDRPYRPDWADGVATMEMVSAAYQAAASGCEVACESGDPTPSRD